MIRGCLLTAAEPNLSSSLFQRHQSKPRATYHDPPSLPPSLPPFIYLWYAFVSSTRATSSSPL
jgi:hypothetical protein